MKFKFVALEISCTIVIGVETIRGGVDTVCGRLQAAALLLDCELLSSKACTHSISIQQSGNADMLLRCVCRQQHVGWRAVRAGRSGGRSGHESAGDFPCTQVPVFPHSPASSCRLPQAFS